MTMKALFNTVSISNQNEDSKYSTKIAIPQYLPNSRKPYIHELCDRQKYLELLSDINRANIDEDVKTFLRLAASRHIVFNYSKIADYYAHSDKDVQRLMEQSALVIIDVNDAIANGYMRLSENIKKMLEETNQ